MVVAAIKKSLDYNNLDIPVIGGPNAFLKVRRLDGMKGGLVMRVVDKKLALESDAAVIELQLRALSKIKLAGKMIVQSIEHAAKSPIEVEGWMEIMSATSVQPPSGSNIQEE